MSQTVENKDQTPPDGSSDFFLVVTPGFESLAEKEILRWLPPDTKRAVERGGLSVRLPLEQGLALNRVLKIPTRILVRLADFGCRDFPKLFKKTSNLPWEKWIPPGASVDFQASSHGSRLAIKKRIEETCRDGFKKYLKKPGVPGSGAAGEAGKSPVTSSVTLTAKSPASTRDSGALAPKSPTSAEFQALVRFDDDICTISLDTSGELLHKRGTKTLSAEAPLRETIAAALLTWMSDGATGDVALIDPMIGSGTFAIEAAQMDHAITERSYAFEKFPVVTNASAGSGTPAPESKLVAAPRAVRFTQFVGFDIDPHAADSAIGNWRALGDKRPLSVKVADIFDAKPLVLEGPRWLITNPPYGERLKIEGRLKDYYELLFEACERVAKPDRACFLLPDTARPDRLKFPRRWKLASTLKFQNGGLPVTALLFVNS